MDFLDWIYSFKFYGADLFEHLKGWDDEIMDYNSAYYQFLSIFASIFGVALVVFLCYYYIANNPRFNRWWNWLLELVSVFIFTGWWGYHVVEVDIESGAIAPSLVEKISYNNAILFGLYNAILASIIFFLLTLLFRHLSKNCKHSPYTSIITKMKKQ